MEAEEPVQQIAGIASWNERWRCKGDSRVDDPLAFRPRERALRRVAADSREDPSSSPLDLNPLFPEVPNKFVGELNWRQVNDQPVFAPEAIHILEMRGFLGALQEATSE